MTLIVDFNSLQPALHEMVAEQVQAVRSKGGAVVYFCHPDEPIPADFPAPSRESRISLILCNDAGEGCLQMLKEINMFTRRFERDPSKVVRRFKPLSVAVATSSDAIAARLQNFFGTHRLGGV